MNIKSKKDPHLCPCSEGIQRGIVAKSRTSSAAVLVSGSCGLVLDFREAGLEAGDALGIDEGFPEGAPRLRVWEGQIVVTPGSWEYPEETDVDYVGTWRDLRAAEWIALAQGRDVFGCTRCDGEGLIAEPFDISQPLKLDADAFLAMHGRPAEEGEPVIVKSRSYPKTDGPGTTWPENPDPEDPDLDLGRKF